MDNFFWFFYIGIFLFITQLFLFTDGIIDISYFGLILIYVGWRKVQLWGWVNFVFWIFIIIEILATIFKLQQKARKYLDPQGELTKDQDEQEEEEEEEEKKDKKEEKEQEEKKEEKEDEKQKNKTKK